jgi:Ca2+/H+ antiporter
LVISPMMTSNMNYIGLIVPCLFVCFWYLLREVIPHFYKDALLCTFTCIYPVLRLMQEQKRDAISKRVQTGLS